jgi:hypothetical protein
MKSYWHGPWASPIPKFYPLASPSIQDGQLLTIKFSLDSQTSVSRCG